MRRILLVQVLICAFQATAHPAVSHYPSVRNLERRQGALPATSSSYDFWWPYPAGVATTAIAANTPNLPAYTTGALVSPPIVTSPAITSAPATNQVVNLPSPMSSSDSSTLPTSTSSPSSSTTSQSSSSTSSTSSAAMITITALPPATKPTRHYKQTGFPTFHPGYLAGIFAVAGAILGVVFTWLLLTIIRKCTSTREKPLVAGAPYSAPAEAQEMNRTLTDIHVSISRFLGAPPPESRPALAGAPSRSRQGSWLQRAFTSHRREGARSRADSALQDSAGVTEPLTAAEDTPFLAPPSRGHTPARLSSTRTGRNVGRERSLMERNVRSPQELEENEALDNAPFNTLRHKSIRRDILQRIQHGSRYRRGHKRVDSDMNPEETRLSEGGESVLTAAFRDSFEGEGIRSPPTSTSIPVPISSMASSGPGFRIIEDDAEFVRSHSKSSVRPSRSQIKDDPTDTYTTLPLKTSSPEKRRVRSPTEMSGTPTRTTPARNTRAHMTRVDSSVLPASPPRVTSPPLEAQLFFDASPGFGPPPKLEFTVSSESHYTGTTQGSPSKKTVHRNKLHTHREPPNLPFPTSSKFSPTKRSTKVIPRPPSLDYSGETRDSSSACGASSSSGPTPAERYARRHGALNKVEQILAESWSARELRGEECPASPNMFGAIPHGQQKGVEGIEQRLLR